VPLTGARAKLRRAEEHCHALDGEIRAFFESNPYRVVVDHPADEFYIFRVDRPPAIPDERWSLLIGDCVHNVRCALDYVAWELAGAHIEDTVTMFPIFITEPLWVSKGRPRIARLALDAQAFIDRLQPYHAVDPDRHPLAGIRALDDADKHKLLTVIAAASEHFAVEWSVPGRRESPPPEPIFTIAADSDLSHGAVIATVTAIGATPDVQMQVEFTPNVAFGKSLGFGPRMHVVDSLRAFIIAATHIVTAVERKFLATH
jgi:hypothetical protein